MNTERRTSNIERRTPTGKGSGNIQYPISKCEVEFGNWILEVGHWKFIMGLRQGEKKR